MKAIFILDTGAILQRYTKEFEELDIAYKNLIRGFFENSVFILSPHVLAEIDARLGKRTAFSGELMGFLQQTEEHLVPKEKILESEAMKKFGIVDAAVALTAKHTGLTLITTDWDLNSWCRKKDIPSVHTDELLFYPGDFK